MHGHRHLETSVADEEGEQEVATLPAKQEVAESYMDKLKMKMLSITSLVNPKLLDPPRQRAILKQLTAVENILKHEPAYQKHVITEPVPAFPTSDQKCTGKISRVMAQYHDFKRKRKRGNVLHASVKNFKTNEGNRHNHFQSFQLSCGVTSELRTTPLKTSPFVFRVVMSSNHISLGGITFMPTIGGIVIGEKC